ncbi:helix-turn-helix transcriptional regulator [Georgenia sp. EYE_87]|uniref:response regulator transcription factor n=1 Tax=Georgenia sp. EYE_87 TaxID=2853448 RepID=UPI0020054691|nr:helix-turn-helix transcriptional regulator [Georgenia sp. EYE_87]MCK6211231.1 helix-turn-helix transcriptional regulator [Georgenia sp. EYE_87]
MGASSRALRWMDVSADVLAAPDARSAHARLVRALSEEFDAFFVVRTLSGPTGTPVARYGPDALARPGVAGTLRSWPEALARVEEHPLVAHLVHDRPTVPVTLTDAVDAGRPLSGATRELIEALGLTVHQLAVPMPGGPGEVFALVADHPIGPEAREAARLLQPMLGGLDRHITLLARVEATARTVTTAPALTPRERLVLHGIAGGSTAEGIAARLAISPRTVHKHQENLYRKLGAVDRLSAVLEAQRAGLLPVGPTVTLGPARGTGKAGTPAVAGQSAGRAAGG